MKPKVIINYNGFVWTWDFRLHCWLIDIELSGGPPDPFQESIEEPPTSIILDFLDGLASYMPPPF